MIRYCITVLENSLTTAMLAALVFAAVWNEGERSALRGKKILAWGCAAGSALALIFAVLRRTTVINTTIVNTWILAAAIAAGIFFIVLLWRGNGASRPGRFSLSSAALAGALLFYTLPPLLLLPSGFVMAGQSVFSTEFLVNLAGAVSGLVLVLLAGFALFRSSVRAAAGSARFPCFKLILTVFLLINMVNYASEVIRFLMARRIIPLWHGLFSIIIAVVNNQPVFIFLGTGAAALLPLLPFIVPSLFKPEVPAEKPARTTLNPAEIRKQKAAARSIRRYRVLALVLLGFSVFALTGLKSWNERAVVLSPAEPFTLAGEEIIIPVTQIEDGHLHRFAWNASDNTEVRFIVVKKSASAWGVGLDACDICGNTGYYERRDGIICRLCDVVMNKSTIGFKGGCNPVPLGYTVRDGAMVVRLEDLEAEKGRFK